MGTREVGYGRSVQVPVVEVEELGPARLEGELDVRAGLVAGGEYAGLVGEGTIDGSVLSGVDLSKSRFRPLTLSDVVLRQVELSNASWQEVVARRVELVSCRAIGVRLSVEVATDLSVVDCKLDYATIHIEKVKGVAVFTGCTFREATISGDLSNTIFVDCDFHETEFRARRATRCDLRSSRLTGARGLLSLKGATISVEQAVAVSAMIAAEAGLVVAD